MELHDVDFIQGHGDPQLIDELNFMSDPPAQDLYSEESLLFETEDWPSQKSLHYQKGTGYCSAPAN